MLAGFCVLHKKHPNGAEAVPGGNEVLTFKTCLRLIHFTWMDESITDIPAEGYDVYRGMEAYQFVLEVICGLHSPVVGETEVFGQFKNFWQSSEITFPLNQIFDNLIGDAKKIRGRHLKDLGGQSYGSLIRKLLRSPTEVALIGGGQFVEEILPWIYKDENRLTVHVRTPEKARALHAKFPNVDLRLLSEKSIQAPVVIIAAPLTSAEIENFVADSGAFVIDLRGESRQDPCQGFANYRDLNSFFEVIQKNQLQISQAKAQALNSIDEISRQRFFMESLRPFGWEDICAW